MNRPIPKEAMVRLMVGHNNAIEVYTATHDADILAKEELPKYGSYCPKGDVRPYHLLFISPLYDAAEVYLYLKELFE